VLVVGGFLRFFPIWFGLPFDEARPDEETAIKLAIQIRGGDLNPHFFHWPSLIFYLFAASFSAASWIRRLVGLTAPLTVNQEYLIARAVVALAGTITIAVVFALARRIAGDAIALLAAVFLAVAPLHVRDSHFAMTDVVMTLLATAALALLVRAAGVRRTAASHRANGVWWFAAAGLAAGLATSTKYSAAALLVAMAPAQWQSAGRSTERWWNAVVWAPSVAFALAFAIGFFAATPYALLDYRSFSADVAFDFTHLAEGHGADLGRGWTHHISRSLPYGLGIPLFVMAVVGIVPMAISFLSPSLIIAAFGAALYAALGRGHTVFFRYILPLVPLACVSAAVAMQRAGDWIARRTGQSSRGIIALAAVAVATPSAVNSAWLDVLLAKTDTRVLAAEWLATRVKPDESLYDAGEPYANASTAGVHIHHWSTETFDPIANDFKSGGRLPDWMVLQESPLETYATVPSGLRRLAAERYELAYHIRATRPDRDPGVYDPQDAFFLPISGFSGVIRPGPTLLIYRRLGLPASLTHTSFWQGNLVRHRQGEFRAPRPRERHAGVFIGDDIVDRKTVGQFLSPPDVRASLNEEAVDPE